MVTLDILSVGLCRALAVGEAEGRESGTRRGIIATYVLTATMGPRASTGITNIILLAPWVPASLAAVRSFHRQGTGVYLLESLTDQRPTPRSFPVLRGSGVIPPDLVGTAEGIAFIKRYADEIEASVLVAVLEPDLVWLAASRQEFAPSCMVLAQTAESLRTLYSKRHQLMLARSAGLSVLPTYLLMRPADADSIPASDFPLALRPDRQECVQPGFKVRLVRSREQLQAMVRGCERISSPIVAQPFKSLPNLVVHGVRSATGRMIASRCYFVPRKFEGVTLAIEPRPFPDRLEEMCHEFARLAGITGCYHLEFLYSAEMNRAYFLEVNVRMGGTTDKVMQLGFDEPSLLLQAYGITPVQPASDGGIHRRVVNKRAVLKHLVSSVKGTLPEFDYPDVHRLTHIVYSFRDLIVAKDSVFDWRDLRGSLRFQFRGVWR